MKLNESQKILKNLNEMDEQINKYIKDTPGDGLVFIDDDGHRYELLEGKDSKGHTSDVVFVFDMDPETTEGGEYITHFCFCFDGIYSDTGIVDFIKKAINKKKGM